MSDRNNFKQNTMYYKSKLPFVAIMIILSVILLITGQTLSDKCSGSLSYTNSPITKDGFFFDTYISISIYDTAENYSSNISSSADIDRLLDECLTICHKYEKIFSPSLADSELFTLNNNVEFLKGNAVYISPELAECITNTLDYSSDFGPKYSIFAGDLSSLWDFTMGKVPDIDNIRLALDSINIYDFFINGHEVSIKNKDISKYLDTPPPSINLGASAKGYIAEKLAQFLKDNGINEGIIDLGGNIVVIGNKFDDSMYTVGIKKPFSADTEPYAVCRLSDKAVVTSGIYERYFEKDGQIYHHIIDCTTGYPAKNDILSVTIISENAFQADCYSTGCLLLGKNAALEFINNNKEVECVIIDKDYNIHLSDGLTYDENNYIIFK